ncbi:MAG: enoyl-CoA hydratase-related protein, partial [Pseudomonadota bacterium]
MTDEPLIRVEGPVQGVAEVVLNRPDKMNAINAALLEAMDAAATALFADPALRAVVLRGEGRAFCAGLDKGNFDRMAETGKPSL